MQETKGTDPKQIGNEVFVRKHRFPGAMITIDGNSGSGKTMLASVIAGFSKTNLPKFSYGIEVLCLGLASGKVSQDFGHTALSLALDEIKLNQALGREVNTRIGDLSSMWGKGKTLANLSLIAGLGGEDHKSTEQRIREKATVLVLQNLFEAGKAITAINPEPTLRLMCTRHPITLLGHWSEWMKISGRSARDLTPELGGVGLETPWFVSSFPDDYLAFDRKNKAAVAVADLTRLFILDLEASKNDSNYHAVIFEDFVRNPEHTLNIVGNFLNENPGAQIKRLLRKEKIPRIVSTAGRSRAIYSRYGAEALMAVDRNSGNTDEMLARAQQAYSLREDVFLYFREIVHDYEGAISKIVTR